MTLTEKVSNDLKDAVRSGDRARIRALRLLHGALLHLSRDYREEITPATELRVLLSEVNQRRDSIEAYRLGGRNDLADATVEEADIMETYLPVFLADDEIRAGVRTIIEETGADGLKDLSIVTRQAVAAMGGRADAHRIRSIISEELKAKEWGR